MAAFNLYRANCLGKERNCLYPHKVCAGDEESLRQAVCQDYVAVEYARGYRSNENFIRTNCLALDCDNGHSENPGEWVSPEKILSQFPDVTVGFHFSRHHNLPKEGQSARPRFHCFFLIDEMTDPEAYKRLKKRINSIFPYFDTKALDAARFFYGTRDPQVQFHEGTITLNECLKLYYPDHEDPFAYTPSHTVVLYTNHLPKVGAKDAGIWRRLIVIPFDAKIEGESDIKNYSDYLFRNAGGAILSWVIEGAANVIRHDFRIPLPECVQRAIRQYREDNDWLGHFLNERCEIGNSLRSKSGELYAAYRSFCADTGEYTRSTTDFYSALENEGFTRQKFRNGSFVTGLALGTKADVTDDFLDLHIK